MELKNVDRLGKRALTFIIHHSSFIIFFLAGGCALLQGNPNQANIELRKKVQKLQSEVAALEMQHDADQRALAAWQQRSPNIPTLPPDRLAELFTVHGLTFGR